MGRSSGGTFGDGVTSAHSSTGRSEAFGPTETNPRRLSRMDDNTYTNTPSSYYDSYWDRSYTDNQRSWRGTQQEPRQREAVQVGYGFFIVFSFFAFFLSMWMLLGLYGSQQLEMGMFYSRMIKANSLFVKEIKVQNLRDRGPVFYSYSIHPELGRPVSDKEVLKDITVDSLCHQRYGFWLNKGSSFDLSINLKDSGSGTDSLVLAIVRGEDGFQEWKGDPSNPSLSLRWKRIHDEGSLSFKVTEDDDYFIVFGNLNSHKMTFSFKLHMSYVLYSKEQADLVCSTQLTDLCEFPVPLGRSTFVVLSSPIVKTLGVDYWKVKVSYVPRWITYFFLWGLVCVGLLFTRAMEIRHGNTQASTHPEQAPLVPEDQVLFPPQAAVPSAPPASFEQVDNFQTEETSVPEEQLCTICFSARKDSFFDPCGHRCTCYSCGLRIQRGDSARCPICRQSIRTVRRIYDA